MRNRKTIIWLFTALLLAGVLLSTQFELTDAITLPFSVSVTADGNTEQLRSWQDESGDYFFFLPGFAQLSQVRISTDCSGELHMDGLSLTDGTSCNSFQTDTPLEVTWDSGSKRHTFTVTFLRSGELPALYLDVKSGSMDYIHQEKNNKESGTLRLYAADGTLQQTLDMAHLETRGNSTVGRLKKPYNLQLTREADLLNMGAAQRWVLLANSYDDSHLRNKAVLDFAREAGLAYSPESQWVDLYLNGEYAGLYLLCERNEVHPQRIDLTGEGSFLVSKEWEWRMSEQGQHFVMTQDQTALRVHYSDLDDDALTAALQSAENAILAQDGIDSITGKHWKSLIDLDSWARKYLIEEVFANVDGGTLSQFFYRDGEGKLCAGPVWDYDLAMANTAAYPAPAANMFFANRENIHGSSWYPALYRDETFFARVTELYETEFQPLLETLLTQTIPAYAELISESAAMDTVRWANRWHTPDPEGETQSILQYMQRRMDFLQSIWLDGEEYHTVLVNIGNGTVMHYAVRPGDVLPELPVYEDTAETDYQGWYLTDSGIPWDITQPIWEDTEIYLRSAPIPAEAAEAEPVSPLRYAPAVLFALLLITVGFWDTLRNKGRKHERKHKVSA